ncbi:MAG: hypothetical protein ACJ71F_05145, partial [Nitrososphaeraceae archaeon]
PILTAVSAFSVSVLTKFWTTIFCYFGFANMHLFVYLVLHLNANYGMILERMKKDLPLLLLI